MSGSGTRRTTILNRRAGQSARLSYWAKRIGPAFALVLIVGYAGVYAWSSGWVDQKQRSFVHSFHEAMVRNGFKVDTILVEGRVFASRDGLKNLIDVERGDSIYQADLDDVRARLEDVTWVKSAVVERHLPDTVYIRLIERTPLALWQKNNKLSVVDEDGVVLTDMGLERFKNLLIIVGEHAPIHAAELVATIEAEPDLKSRVESAKWVGDRRWDLFLKNGVSIRLPEEDLGEALRRLASAQAEGKVMDRKIESIDLRDPMRLVVQTSPGAEQDYQAAYTPDKNI
jgi:cell division protein FtsQ